MRAKILILLVGTEQREREGGGDECLARCGSGVAGLAPALLFKPTRRTNLLRGGLSFLVAPWAREPEFSGEFPCQSPVVDYGSLGQDADDDSQLL